MLLRNLRSAVGGELLLGAAGSVAFTLYAAQRVGAPAILEVLFSGWVLTPFIALASGLMITTRWPALMRRALETVTPVVAFVSLAIYGAVAFGSARPKTAVFVLVAPASLLVIAVALATTARLTRRPQQPRAR